MKKRKLAGVKESSVQKTVIDRLHLQPWARFHNPDKIRSPRGADAKTKRRIRKMRDEMWRADVEWLLKNSQAYLFWRQNCGAFKAASGFVRTGPNGWTDLYGWSVNYLNSPMVRPIGIETKRPEKGLQSHSQVTFQMLTEGLGGLYLLASDPDQTVDAVARALEVERADRRFSFPE